MVFGKLVVVKKTGELGDAFEIDADISCGRDKECDIRIKLPSVSRQHFKIRVDENGNCLLENTSSTNPTLINNRETIRSLVTLQDGDEIKVADRKLIFSTVKKVATKVLSATSNSLSGFLPVLETIDEVNTSNLSIELDSAILLAEKNDTASSVVVLSAQPAANSAEVSAANSPLMKSSVEETLTNLSPASVKKDEPRKNTPRKPSIGELFSSQQAPVADGSPLFVPEDASQKKRKLATPLLKGIQSRRNNTPGSAVASTSNEEPATAVVAASIPHTGAAIHTTASVIETEEKADTLAEPVLMSSEEDKVSKKLGTPLLKSIQNRRVKTPATAAAVMSPFNEVATSTVVAAADGSATSSQPVSVYKEETKEELVEEDMHPLKRKLGTPLLKCITNRRVATPASGAAAAALSSAPISPPLSSTSKEPVLSSSKNSQRILEDTTLMTKQEEEGTPDPVPVGPIFILKDIAIAAAAAAELLGLSSKAKLGTPLLKSIQSRRAKTPASAKEVEMLVEGEGQTIVQEALTSEIIARKPEASSDMHDVSQVVVSSEPEYAAAAIPASSHSPASVQVLSADITMALSARRKSLDSSKSPAKSPIPSASRGPSHSTISKSAPRESMTPATTDKDAAAVPVPLSSAAEVVPTTELKADTDDVNMEAIGGDTDFLATVAKKRGALPSRRLSFSAEVAATLLQGSMLSESSDAVSCASSLPAEADQQASESAAAVDLAKRAEARLERIKRNFIAAIKSRKNQNRASFSGSPIVLDIAANEPAVASTVIAEEEEEEEEEEVLHDETVTALLQEPPARTTEQPTIDVSRRTVARRWPRLDKLSGSTKSFFCAIRTVKRTCLLRRPPTSAVTKDDVEASGVLTRAVFVAACAQISVDAFASELERKGVADEKAYGEALSVFLSDPQAFMEVEEAECTVDQDPQSSCATDVITVAGIASTQKKSQRRRESLLLSLEKKPITAGRAGFDSFLSSAMQLGFGVENRSTLSREAESLCCDLIASLSDEEMRLIDEYAEKLTFTGLESAEAHAVAVDCYIRGIERCNDLLSSTAAAAVVDETVAVGPASESMAELTIQSPPSAPAAVAKAPVASKATAELGFFGSSLRALFNDEESSFADEQLVSFYADHMSEISGVDPSVAYGIALDSFLAETALFRSKVGRIYGALNAPVDAPKTPVSACSSTEMEQREANEVQGGDYKFMDVVDDKPTVEAVELVPIIAASISTAEQMLGQSEEINSAVQTMSVLVESVVEPVSQEAAPLSDASRANTGAIGEISIDEAVPHVPVIVPEVAAKAAPYASASMVESGKKKATARGNGKAKSAVAAAIPGETKIATTASLLPSAPPCSSKQATDAIFIECAVIAIDPQDATDQTAASTLKKRPADATAAVAIKQPAVKRGKKAAVPAEIVGAAEPIAIFAVSMKGNIDVKAPAASGRKASPATASLSQVDPALAAATDSEAKSATTAPSSRRKTATKADTSARIDDVVTLPSLALFSAVTTVLKEEVDEKKPDPKPAVESRRGTKRAAAFTAVALKNKMQKEKTRPVVDVEEEALAILCDGCDGEFIFEELGLAAVPEGDWFCDKCVKTKRGKAKATTKSSSKALVILCDGCDGEYIFEELGLAAVPEGDWFCDKCVKTKRGKAKATPKSSSRCQLQPKEKEASANIAPPATTIAVNKKGKLTKAVQYEPAARRSVRLK